MPIRGQIRESLGAQRAKVLQMKAVRDEGLPIARDLGGQRPGMSPGEGRCEAEQQRQPQERATEDSGQPRVGQGIAEQALLGRPADAQGPARGERGEHAR